ncbi:MAG: hypothetical protein Q7R43_00530 [Candidatus Daviesbacteria bacterium]|nr:hypothetical protein [Candidatus Daviesbacteria bacterium]
MKDIKSKSLPWDVVEKAISKEIKWLEETIMDSPFRYEETVCSKCIFRRIALLILYGKVKAKDIKSSISLWGENYSFFIGKSHGQEWHSEMIKLVASYFSSLGYEIVIEPYLNQGRADLGVYKDKKRNLFVEIGTVSLSKILFNLESMEESDFLLVLDLNHAVEFSILKGGLKR